MNDLRISQTLTFHHVSCGNCGVGFALESSMHADRLATGGLFYCPNGHHIGWGDNQVKRLKASLAVTERRLQEYQAEVERARAQRDQANLSAAIIRGKARAMRMPSDEMKRYKADVVSRLRQAGWKPVSGPMVLSITWRRKIKSGDLSNRVKVLEDALKGLAWHDDSQVVELHCYRQDDPENAGVTVTVEAAA